MLRAVPALVPWGYGVCRLEIGVSQTPPRDLTPFPGDPQRAIEPPPHHAPPGIHKDVDLGPSKTVLKHKPVAALSGETYMFVTGSSTYIKLFPEFHKWCK